MELNEVIKILGQLGRDAKEEGYRGDATKYAFRKYTLILLKEIIDGLKDLENTVKKVKKQKREPSRYNLHIAKEISKGKTFHEAVKSWTNK